MSIINEYSKQKTETDQILALSQKANKHKQCDSTVINATVGMMFDEDGKFSTYQAVEDIETKLASIDKFGYSATSGGNNYQKIVEEWIFGDNIDFIKQNFYLHTVATIGGSGALAIAFSNYLEAGETVLLPNMMWTPYLQFAKERKVKTTTYNLVKDDCLDIADIEKTINLVEGNKVLLIINDPCHNPTGFTMSENDYDKLIEILNRCQKQIVLLLDISYFDYTSDLGQEVRTYYQKLIKLRTDIVTLFAFSGSKTFGLYGLRIGACTILTKEQQEYELFKTATEFTARATWSSPSHFGVSLIEEIITNQKSQFRIELKNNAILLENRSKVFLEEASKFPLQLSPYIIGFFIVVYFDKPLELTQKLQEKKVYVCPLNNGIRIAFSSISIEEARKLPKIIYECEVEIENEFL